jgi:hypothetical protein
MDLAFHPGALLFILLLCHSTTLYGHCLLAIPASERSQLETLLRYQNALSRPTVPLLSRLGARVEIDHTKLPVAVVGTNSVVFRLTQDSGQKLSLRLPLDEHGAAEWEVRYGSLAAFERGTLDSRLSRRFEVHRHAVSVATADGHDVTPVTALVSEWIEGPTLIAAADRAARAGNVQILRALAGAVRDAINELRRTGFVHGDITAQNLIVGTNGQIAFIDLDTASWPNSPLGSTGSGSPGYRHPAGATSTTLRDSFPLLVLYASLIALAENPDRRRSWGDPISTPNAVLLLSEWDLGAPDNSECFRDITRQSGREVSRLFLALQRVLHDGPESIERHLSAIPSLAPIAKIESTGTSSTSAWDLNAAVRRVRSRFDSKEAPPATNVPAPEHPTWTVPAAVEPAAMDDDRGVVELREAFIQALADHSEGEVAVLWAKVSRDPVARTMTMQMEELYATTLSERIDRENKQGRDALVISIAEEARMRNIALPTSARTQIRAAKDRTAVRLRLDQALESDSREELTDLAVSGQLVVLGDADRKSLVRVLQALEWPLLERALETDDDRIILNTYDEELFGDSDALPKSVVRRVELARARLQWADRVRAALHQRLASEVTALFDSTPDRAESHLSASERKRAHKIVEQHRAMRQLAESIQSGDEAEIVSALATVERVGARLGQHFPWHAIRDVLERVSLIEDIMDAAKSRPVDHAKLAQLIPAAKAIGLDKDPRLGGEYAIESLQTKLIQAAHLRRLRTAIMLDDDVRIVGTALPDVYDVLDELTDTERKRVAGAIRSQRRQNRHAVAARFEA